MIPSLWRFLLFISLGFACDHPTTDDVAKINEGITTIKQAFAPDRRVQIFDITLSEDGHTLSGETNHSEAYEALSELAKKWPTLTNFEVELQKPLGYGVVHVSVCNMRSQPKHSAELSTQALLGHPLTLWKKEGSWYYVQSPDHYFGWLDAGAFTLLTETELQSYQQQPKVMYVKDFGFAYESPKENSSVVSDLVAGNILTIKSQTASHFECQYPDGRIGFIPLADGITQLPSLQEGTIQWASIQSTAYQFMGRPYLWGGTSGKGVDCSGFTKMVYYLNGMVLPRDASQQVKVGKEIPLDPNFEGLQAGDFLFFGEKGNDGKPDKVTHVAIHLDQGRMIHAAERVQIESVNPNHPDYNEYRHKTLLGARRMLENNSLMSGVIELKNHPNYAWN